MSSLPIAIAAGVLGGLVAAAVMNGYQSAAGPLFGVDASDDDPSTVKAADAARRIVGAPPIAQENKARAGNLVHYATGAAIGAAYGALAAEWPSATIGFGTAFGVATALTLDTIAVPALGWGPPPQKTSPMMHVYGLSSHIVFGAALEGVRRLATRRVASA